MAQDRSFRIGTFNAFMKPAGGVPICVPPAQCLDEFLPDAWNPSVLPPQPLCIGDLCEVGRSIFNLFDLTQGAYDLASRIRAGGYDLVVLNEVFEDDAKNVLISELEAEYPWILKTADTTDPGAHSGLMLFAKPHLHFIQHHANDECGKNRPPSIGWMVTVRVPGHAGDCTWNTQLGGAQCDLGTGLGPFATFVEFGNHGSGSDGTMANKGVAYVQVWDSTSGITHNVFLTHFEAGYEDDYDPSDPDKDSIAEMPWYPWHADELNDVKDLYGCLAEKSVIDPALQHSWLLGDLNIDGDQTAPINSATEGLESNKFEWTIHFDTSPSFFTDKLGDAWVRETPNTDPGITSKNESHISFDPQSALGKRIDYILHDAPNSSEPDVQLCNQHMTLAYNLRDYQGPPFGKWTEGGMDPGGRGPTSGDGLRGTWPTIGWFSDHLGVNANYNAKTPQCSPLDREDALVVYGDSDLGAISFKHEDVGNDPSTGFADLNWTERLHEGELEVVGALDWWKLEHAGQYHIGLTKSSLEAGFRVTVYHHADFSQPWPSYRDEEFTLAQFADQEDVITGKYMLLHPPYYLRVHNIDHNQTGQYDLAIRRLTCTDKYAMACLLYPNQDNGAWQFPASQPIELSSPSLDSLYFVFDALTPTNGTSVQSLRTILHGYSENRLGAFIVGPHDDDTLERFEPVFSTSYPLQNTFNVEREVLNGHSVSEEEWPGCPGGTGTMGDANFSACNNVILFDNPAPATPRGERFILRVTRVDEDGCPTTECSEEYAPVTFSATWQSNLTAMPATTELNEEIVSLDHRLSSIEQSELSKKDEIHMRVNVDGLYVGGYSPGSWTMPSLGGDCSSFDAFWLGPMDPDGDGAKYLPLSGYLTQSPLQPTTLSYKFVGGIVFELVEEDDCPSGGSAPSPDGPEQGNFEFLSLAFDDFGAHSSLVRAQGEMSLSGSGLYVIGVNLNHGTQQWEVPFHTGDASQDCIVQGSCSISATPGASIDEVPARAVDLITSPAPHYASVVTISPATPFWELELFEIQFISTVRVLAAPGRETELDDAFVAVSTDQVNWIFSPAPSSWPTHGEYVEFSFGVPARYVWIGRSVPGALTIEDVDVFGY